MDAAVRELLQTLLTMVDERRHSASQASEVARRRAGDTEDASTKLGYMRHRDEFLRKEKEFKDLTLEMRNVIEEEFGASWEEEQ